MNDARRRCVVVEPIAVNASEWWSFVDERGALRLGYHLVRGMGEAQRTNVERALAQDRPFEDLLDFARRTALSREALENLAAGGAFAPWFPTRREAIWALRGLDERETRGELGRAMEIDDEPRPRLLELTAVERTAFDIAATGVADVQPIAHFRAELDAQNVLAAERLPAMPNDRCLVGGLVITRQRPGTAKGCVFLTLGGRDRLGQRDRPTRHLRTLPSDDPRLTMPDRRGRAAKGIRRDRPDHEALPALRHARHHRQGARTQFPVRATHACHPEDDASSVSSSRRRATT